MKSVQTKILSLILGCVLLSGVLLSGAGILSAKSVIDNNSAEIMNLICSEKVQELDEILLNIEQSVKTVFHYANGQLDQLEEAGKPVTDQVNMDSYIEKVRGVALNAAENTEGAIAVYLRFNPDITSSVAGMFLRKEENDNTFMDAEITDLLEYDSDDIGHVGWYYLPIKTGEPMWLDPYYNENINVNMISYVIPIFRDGAAVGVIGMDIEIELLVEQVQSITVYDSGDALLGDAVGNLVYHREHKEGVKVEDLDKDLEELRLLLENYHKSGEIVEYTWRGQEKKMVYMTLRNGMNLAINAPTKEIDAPKDKLIYQSIGLLIGILVVSGLLTIYVTKKLVAPLRQITLAAEKIAGGDLNVEIECKSKDEVGILSKSFQQTVSNLKQYINYINDLAYMDSHTGARNKTAYMDAVERIENNMKTQNFTYAVVVMDINGLKLVNDKNGHEYGDMLIMDAVKIMKHTFEGCEVYRIGGDEFVVILEDGQAEACYKFIQKLEEQMEKFNAINHKYENGLQIAKGAAIYEKEVDYEYCDVFRRADQAMYENKSYMKNRDII